MRNDARPGRERITLRRPSEHMIQLKGLTKRYGTFTAVDAINLEVPGKLEVSTAEATLCQL